MKNTDKTKEIEFSAGSYPSFICVYPVNLWFDCSKLLLRDPAKMKPVKLCAEHLGLLQPAVALGDAALLLA